jgi:hypothetical protein
LIRASGSNVKKNRAETDGTIPPVSASTKEDQYGYLSRNDEYSPLLYMLYIGEAGND